MLWACSISLRCAAHAAEASRVLRINAITSRQPQRYRPACTHRLYKHTAKQRTRSISELSSTAPRSLLHTHTASSSVARASAERRHYRGLLRALLVAAAECDHTACFARAVVGSGVQNLQRVTHAHAAALTAWPRRRNSALPLAGASKRLTDALTKLLMPGTSTRDMSAWVVSTNKLVQRESC